MPMSNEYIWCIRGGTQYRISLDACINKVCTNRVACREFQSYKSKTAISLLRTSSVIVHVDKEDKIIAIEIPESEFRISNIPVPDYPEVDPKECKCTRGLYTCAREVTANGARIRFKYNRDPGDINKIHLIDIEIEESSINTLKEKVASSKYSEKEDKPKTELESLKNKIVDIPYPNWLEDFYETPMWMEVWKSRPEMQDIMLKYVAYRRNHTLPAVINSNLPNIKECKRYSPMSLLDDLSGEVESICYFCTGRLKCYSYNSYKGIL